jgi:hypothetical protein
MEVMTMNEQIQIGRAKNAVLDYFERTLSIPKIYLDADWNGSHLDVLAINRDGAGDVHAAALFLLVHRENGDLDLEESSKRFGELMERLHTLSAHFKWIAAVGDRRSGAISFDEYNKRSDEMYASDGLGRIGFLQVAFDEHQEPTAQVAIKAERFRAKVSDLADSYIEAHSADWEIRA